ncbi:MAG: hypothetical protein KBS40_05790 [Bacteroidales bacterium]|nr:hypothetical protein [Bacteroidales bacterium]
MKNNRIFLMLLCGVVMMLTACKQSELVFDYENPQFETKANAILLEVVVPAGTSASDNIYMIGAVNGGTVETYENPDYLLQKASKTDYVFGIYLYPEDFAPGTSLADGFRFVSSIQGDEVGDNHVLANAQVGQRYRIEIPKWTKSQQGTVTHDGYCVYIIDELGWGKSTRLYTYKDDAPYHAEWPGLSITGTETVKGVPYYYFDMGEAATGLTLNLIFSNNGDGTTQLPTYAYTVTKNIFLKLTADGVVEVKEPTEGHNGMVVYVLDGMNWGQNTTLYMWGDVNDLNGGWPGMKVDGTEQFGDYVYMYYDMGESNAGLKESLIFSKNGSAQLGDFPGNNTFYTLGTTGDTLCLYISSDGVQIIEDPANPGDVVWYDPKPKEKIPAHISLYMYDATDKMNYCRDTVMDTVAVVDKFIYAWGTSEICGGWPGANLSLMEKETILGLELLRYDIDCYVDDYFSIILNNKGKHGIDFEEGTQYDAFDLKATEEMNVYYFTITDTVAKPLTVVPVKTNKRR